MSAQHTSGPLSVHRTHDTNHNAEHVIRAPDGSPLARVSSYMGTSYANRQANAELFAAAGELLSLLEDAVAFTAPHVEGGEADEWVVAARAAISKATGGVS